LPIVRGYSHSCSGDAAPAKSLSYAAPVTGFARGAK